MYLHTRGSAPGKSADVVRELLGDPGVEYALLASAAALVLVHALGPSVCSRLRAALVTGLPVGVVDGGPVVGVV